MGKKGEKKIKKRLNASKRLKIKRKGEKFTIKTNAGSHKSDNAIPLAYILRDLLKITRNLKETKYLLSKGKVFVNSKTKKNYRFNVGLFDVIELPDIKKKYRIELDRKGRFISKEAKEPETKLVKIINKKTVKGKKIVLITNDGRQIEDKENKIKTGDSIKMNLKTNKILLHLPLQKKSKVYIIGGKHAGEKAKIHEIREGNISKPKLVLLKSEEQQFETLAKNVIVIE